MADEHDRPLFIRNLQAGQLCETFLVSAVAALLAVRFLLSATGYPRLGSGGLHIAHMLWGGGLMLAALLVLLSYLGHRIRRIAAVIGGLGFGLFIDELGKFITSDNNYFYRPAIALIYVIFILLFLWWRSLERSRSWTEEIYLANALMLLQDAALADLDQAEKYHLLRWLRLSGSAGTSLLGDLRQVVAVRPPDVAGRSVAIRQLRRVQRAAARAFRARWTGPIAVSILLARALGGAMFAAILALNPRASLHGISANLPLLAATVVSTGLSFIGLVNLRHSRVDALRWFKRSILASIFVTDLFIFYYAQLGGLLNLAVDLVLLVVFEALIDAEHRRAGIHEASIS